MIHSNLDVLMSETFRYTIIPNPNKGAFLLRLETQSSVDIVLKQINPIGQVVETRMLKNP